MTQNEKNIALKDWQAYCTEMQRLEPMLTDETPAQRAARVNQLERDPEAWFRYYFEKYYKSEPANFHRRATRRIINNAEWYEVRAWSRELAKTARCMMETIYQAMTGRVKNVLMVSNSHDNAELLLTPYKLFFELNPRLIADYKEQATFGNWKAGKFTIAKGKILFTSRYCCQ